MTTDGDVRRDIDVTVISGLSGAGRSEAARALEDLGWFVVDNLPPALIDRVISLATGSGGGVRKLALVIDARGGQFFAEAAEALDKARAQVGGFTLVFLDAADDVLVRRFEASRRRHPLASEDRVVVGIQRERQLMRPLYEGADLIIDTSELNVRELRTRIGSFFEGATGAEGLRTTVISFGYKFGLPLDADIVLDVRFLPNPHWVQGLREKTGVVEEVRDYVLGHSETKEFLEHVNALLAATLPAFQKEGRRYLTIAVGCTGGRHRSVVLADAICSFIQDQGFPAKAIHRDVERAPVEP